MKCLSASVGLILIGSMSFAGSLADHPFFKAVAGEWVGEGSLTNAEGEEIPIHEEWKGSKNEEGGFSVEGTRQWGEESQEFRWVYLRNQATELYECEYWHTGMEEPVQFQVQLSDGAVEMTAPIGGGELKVRNRLKDGTIVGEIALTGESGEASLTGTVTHRKKT
jgi:hypothetical protein